MKHATPFLIILMFLCSLPALAVSDKDMEQAKVIAAKLYLRWTNNGSGYLDQVSASSMADLESKLKPKEIENLKAFKSVPIPADYPTWDKERFVQFWGTTFFTSPSLSADGKRAKDRVKDQVKKIKTAAPQAAAAPAPQPEAAAPAPAAEPKPEATPAETAAPEPAADASLTLTADSMQQEADNLSDQIIAAEAEAEELSTRKEKSNTWVYVAILVVLVGVVIWLMVYAANMMKKQGKEPNGAASSTPGRDDIRVREMQSQLAGAREQNAGQAREIAELNTRLDEARNEIQRLKALLAKEQTAHAAQAPQPKPEPKPEPKIITDIYLGRANAKGQFVRGDRRPNPEHTVFHLDTKDGMVGTFVIAETPDAVRLACSNPFQFLVGGCNSENFEDAETATRIITETPGTAMFENGCWKVLRKAHIRFE